VEVGFDEAGIDEAGIDEAGIDEAGIDEALASPIHSQYSMATARMPAMPRQHRPYRVASDSIPCPPASERGGCAHCAPT